MEPSEFELEHMLRAHFAGELDTHRGQAARAFAREVTRPMRRRLFRDALRRQIARHRPQAQRWATIGLAMAACTAIGFYLPRELSRPAVTDIATNQPKAVAPALTPDGKVKVITPAYAGFERTTVVNHVDQGSGLTPDGNFGRTIRQHRLDTFLFTDPATHDRYECTVPSDEDLFVPLGRQ